MWSTVDACDQPLADGASAMIGFRVHSSPAGVGARPRLPWRDPHGNHVEQSAGRERSSRKSAFAEFPIGQLARVLEELAAAPIDGFVQSAGEAGLRSVRGRMRVDVALEKIRICSRRSHLQGSNNE